MTHVIKKDHYLQVLLILLAVFIQQSTLVAGFNASLSDVILLLLCIHIWRNYRNWISGKTFILFFVALIIYRFCITLGILFFESYMTLTMKEMISSLLKLTVTFIYFFLGYNIIKFKDEIPSFFKAYVISSAFIGVICIIGSLTGQAFITKYFFFDDIRAQGLMNDPNYFTLTQVIGLCLSINLFKNKVFQYLIMVILIFAIFSSGSKTALIIMIIIGFALFVIAFSNLTLKSYLSLAIILSLVIFAVFSIINFNIINVEAVKQFPSVERMMTVFSEGTTSIDDSGSNRMVVWENGIKIFKFTLGFGVGLFDYSHIGLTINQVGEVAHNTFIQILGEWGIIFSTIFLGFLGLILTRIFKVKDFKVLSCLLVLFLAIVVYGFTISLNNSRLAALFIGVMTAYVSFNKRVRGERDD